MLPSGEANTYLLYLYIRLVAENGNLDGANAPGLNDRKSPNIRNIGRLAIVQPPELLR